MFVKIKFLLFHLARLLVKLIYHDAVVIYSKLRSRVSKKSSVLFIADGERSHENNHYAIFLIYQPKQISWYVKNALDSLNSAGVNVIVIVNHSVNDSQLLFLKENSKSIMVRNNSGFDIGAFRDATIYLNSRNHDVERVLYLNDSTYFFKSGLTELFSNLVTSKADICAPFENWEIHYHIQSFCFSIDGSIFRHPSFQKFWIDYIPVNSRLWAINKGEVGLSRTMIPIANSIDIVYKPNNLRAHLSEVVTLDDRMKLARLIPIPIRGQSSELCSLTQSEVTQFFISKIGGGSQIHTGGFIYRRYERCPLIKRDLLYRGQFTIDEIEEALIETGHEDHFDEIMTDFRRKGKANQLPVIKKLQAASGII
ncbi:rhamnan synthesis F family protein [Bosea sp. (in: a-proteobacteria)]|jgi:hypothetical protein|uniref:rhamnan synthesis F family protein n=1 Tax=Bosea sp. (in: a-proteobacteria) TaxID=1871050 RepID=UPI002DDD69F0|nr:rhamnan synthesis F family protein [Bosea sp. (in: a-proteobacteria)]HEV2510847.1 rhamnan synthesis F family protein [Bosea sp. (in: a-proteobacteria)]